MTDGVRPIPPIAGNERRSGDRRATQRRTPGEGPASRALVPSDVEPDSAQNGPAQDGPAEPAQRATLIRDVSAAPAAAFAAQLIGQGGQRTGIRGGPPVMDAARSTYLGAEYSGEKERRPPVGKTGKTEV